MSEQPLDSALPEGEEHAPPGTRLMAVLRWLLVLLMAALAGAALWYSRRSSESAAAAQGQAGEVYVCPMHPGVQQDRPGECPICNMTLVRKETAPAGAPHAHEAAGPKNLVPITLGPERIQRIGMRTAEVMQRRLAPELRTVGVVAADENRRSEIHARFAGWIERLDVAETGQAVKRNQVLAHLYSPELLAAAEELRTAAAWVPGTAAAAAGVVADEATHPHAASAGNETSRLTQDLARDARRRLVLLGLSDSDIDTLVRDKTLRALPLRAPQNGFVMRRDVLEGSYVQPGSPLFEVADLSGVWVWADVYEYEIGRVHVGQRATVEVSARPGESMQGTVQFIEPMVDTDTRTLRVRLVFRNPGLRLRPGMVGDVRIALDAADALTVPAEAVVDTGEAQYVFVAQPGGRFEPRSVVLGARDGFAGVGEGERRVAVLRGLHAGETVVTTANFLIDSESRLRAALTAQGASGAGGTAMPGGHAGHTGHNGGNP